MLSHFNLDSAQQNTTMHHSIAEPWPTWHISINYHDSQPPRNMSWQPHGLSKSGFIQTSHHGQSQTVPAVVAHRGRLWCMWTDQSGHIWYTFTNDEDETQFLPRKPFQTPGLPVIANLNGHLHVIVVLGTGGMAHYVLDDEDEPVWVCVGLLQGVASPNPFSIRQPGVSLVAFQKKLLLAFLNSGVLYYVVWNPLEVGQIGSTPTGTWSRPLRVSASSQIFDGIPALFVIKEVLHLLCPTKSESCQILCYSHDNASSTWASCPDISEGRAACGVSATSYGDNAYLGFIENGPGDQSHGVYIASFKDGTWSPQESVARQTAADPPQIAILNGRIHCIFNDNTPTKDLRWYSRPILSYSLSSWMAKLPGTTLLSQITIPGTHDSCARSNIPYVRTQYLSITQQLSLGIRFLDLRLRRHDDGQLFVYHGGVPIGLSTRLSFAAVMSEVWAFLRGPDGLSNPTETVIVSIDNDDISPDQKLSPEIFYSAVESAIDTTPPYPDGTPRWFVEPVTPFLGQVRGRAVLFRRYLGDPTIESTARQGLDLSAWINDSPDFTIVTPTNIRVHLQDKWRFSERISLKDLIATKSGFVQNMMTRAASSSPLASPTKMENGNGDTDWYINFCSAVGDPTKSGEVAQAKWIAAGARSIWVGGKWVTGMNRTTREFVEAQKEGLFQGGDGNGRRYRLGVVNLDYPELPTDNDIVARLIEVNFGE